MTTSEFTHKRAEILNKLRLPDIDTDIGMKLLWFDCVFGDNIASNIRLDTHLHSFFEIHFVFSGTVSYQLGDSTVTLSDNEALIIPPNLEHRYLSCRSDLVKLSVAFGTDKLTLFDTENISRFTISDSIRNNAAHIFSLADRMDVLTRTVIGGRCAEIIRDVCDAVNYELPELEGEMCDPRVTVAKEFIRANTSRIITQDDVAKECCLSSKQLGRIFKSCVGCTVFEYITSTKLNKAERLLVCGEYSVKEVGFMLGFESESGFASFFKRHRGVSPGSYKDKSAEKQIGLQ